MRLLDLFFGHSELVSESCQLCVLTAFEVNFVLIRLKSVIWSDPEQLENYGYVSLFSALSG